MSFTRPNKTGESTPNDRVMTPVNAASWIIDYFKPNGTCLEPCRGNKKGSFYSKLPYPKIWCEIKERKDFFKFNGMVDWIITNPPFSIYDLFLEKALSCSKNVVFLTTLNKVFKSHKIDDMIFTFGGIAEVVMMGGGTKFGFPFGFPCGCIYFKKEYHGDMKITRAYNWFKESPDERK